jgi:hypothetical protein
MKSEEIKYLGFSLFTYSKLLLDFRVLKQFLCRQPLTLKQIKMLR